jgi:hypothetical protein
MSVVRIHPGILKIKAELKNSAFFIPQFLKKY